ncbi:MULTISPECIES: RNA-guided endonuclease TnpB family protein [unclassified Mycolicibacterium]|uniref:RNA-guided endonuclease InsQ/TnpB family protein n=1 Tax=unclassified Mycolicibacterium TaxID=2636767 RepID=UPI0012DE441B|nr:MULTISPECIES: RNA-guided endonuclease TnpB family protein [unclassified Mycolicibacterium]MUL84387.1 IS200/IS605 family element transposase accessory protein TnpB [Mycolicibacterium sp. CBMA 329]MUL88162.1 IS200/IS605 family element transposase accessory protein TnpB [Mycolicibacterium sp. CBMA 331]MUM02449.1 IS200/IS605 family element transposase accessory protein TnpB [Mycolicibacterium sp. CBMA 334]MUM25993.1 IS200/IS605 family element transposase accessory protein TnpB [Mycolicibacterium
MKLVVQLRLEADAAQLDVLARTLIACNETANLVSTIAHRQAVFRRRDLRAITYALARQHAGLGAQVAQPCIRKVADAYTTLRSNLGSGRYGVPGSTRRQKVQANPIRFQSLAAQPFDGRCLSWSHDADTDTGGMVSIWTVDGRLKNLRFTGEPDQIALLRTSRSGETDLVLRRRRRGALTAFLIATVEVPEPLACTGAHLQSSDGWIGVDMGVENIAVTSDRPLARELLATYGAGASDGAAGRGSVKDRRTRNRELRQKLQRKNTKSAKRLLRKRARREARFAADVNHQISKRIVTEAERTGRGIAVEELTGIRERVRLRKPQRATHASWAFAQLGVFLTYKAARAGVPIVQVDPAYTSQRCTACGHIDRRNRTSQAEFVCRDCGFTAEHADILGADNIAHRAPTTWAQSTAPSAA